MLRRAEIEFDALPAHVDERPPFEGESETDYARALSVYKADAVTVSHPGTPVLGADTVVAIDGHILGKPGSPEEARGMLSRLRGKEHRVVTGVSLIRGHTRLSDVVVARVTMRQFSDEEMIRYIETGEPLDKAGAYAVQGHGGVLVDHVDGCYLTVVGLPLCRTLALLDRVGISSPNREWCSHCPRMGRTLLSC